MAHDSLSTENATAHEHSKVSRGSKQDHETKEKDGEPFGGRAFYKHFVPTGRGKRLAGPVILSVEIRRAPQSAYRLA